MHDQLRPQVGQHVDKLGSEETDKIEVQFPYKQSCQSRQEWRTMIKKEVELLIVFNQETKIARLFEYLLLSVIS